MVLKEHINYSFIAFLILAWFLKMKAIYFFFASVLIDMDHYFDYALRNHDLSLHRMFKYHEELFEYTKTNPYLGISVLHTVEFIAPCCLGARGDRLLFKVRFIKC
jgi:hypothetical protein